MTKTVCKYLHKGEAGLRKHLREHDQKAALSSDTIKVEMSLELANSRLSENSN